MTKSNRLHCIVACNLDGAIGNDGRLLYHIQKDLDRFKFLTSGQPIVYGYKTLMTFPNLKPLRNRDNIILSHDENLVIEGATVLHSLNEFFEYIADNYEDKDIYVCGGESIYNQLLPFCDYIDLTLIYTCDIEADAFFPVRDYTRYRSYWTKAYESEMFFDAGYQCQYKFITYRRG